MNVRLFFNLGRSIKLLLSRFDASAPVRAHPPPPSLLASPVCAQTPSWLGQSALPGGLELGAVAIPDESGMRPACVPG